MDGTTPGSLEMSYGTYAYASSRGVAAIPFRYGIIDLIVLAARALARWHRARRRSGGLGA